MADTSEQVERVPHLQRRRRPGEDQREVVLRVEGISTSVPRGKDRVACLTDISLEIRAGERVALTGPSGSGKSTLLNVIAGLSEPDSGRVVIGDIDVTKADRRARARIRLRSIGFVFQFFHLVPTLTVAQNIALPMALARRRDAERVSRLLEAVGLAGRGDDVPGVLSGGELQRVAVARALALSPRLILADEPTGALDSKNGTLVLDLLTTQATDIGAALIIVTHDRAVAKRADRRLELLDGSIS